MPPVAMSHTVAPPSIRSVRLPAPTGGINTVVPASAMPPSDCVYLYNLIGSELGLRSRLGYIEWVTGLDGPVRSMVPFSGGAQSGSADRLFAATASGMWGASTSTDSPSQALAFGITTGSAGLGISCVVSTPGGRFLLYTDEENGLHVYSENSGSWSKVNLGTTVLWEGSADYVSGNQVVNGGKVYVCTVGGISAVSGGPTGTGVAITDGTCTWNYVSLAASGVIGPSLADQNLGYTGDPATFVFCGVWKNRVWFVEKNSSRAWYGGVNAIFGTFTSFDFGPKFAHGGPLVGLYNWSYDGGGGMDTKLVGISTTGDIVIYGGTDPTQASSFSLVGCWYVGGVVSGRRVATDYGGDVLVASILGALPLSRLVSGAAAEDRSQYTTYKIGSLFNQLADTYRALPGWSLQVHPTDNALLVTVPLALDTPTVQLAYSFATKGWSRYRELPILSCGVWNGTLFFGTADGRVCRNEGYDDDVKLANPNEYKPVVYSILSAYQNLGAPRNKRVQMLRPIVLSEGLNPVVQATARYGFDLSEPGPPTGSAPSTATGTSVWDTAVWDTAVWPGDNTQTPAQGIMGAKGMGRDVAVAVRGTATSRTTVVGVDVLFDVGGLL